MRRNVLITYIILLAIIVLALAYYAANIGRDNDTESVYTSPTVTVTESPTATTSPTQSTENIVTYSAEGFSPASIVVSVGTAVQFLNQSTQDMWPASDPYPDHTNYPEFNSQGAISPDESYTFTFTQPGTWGFHNHLSPEQKGTVTVR